MTNSSEKKEADIEIKDIKSIGMNNINIDKNINNMRINREKADYKVNTPVTAGQMVKGRMALGQQKDKEDISKINISPLRKDL